MLSVAELMSPVLFDHSVWYRVHLFLFPYLLLSISKNLASGVRVSHEASWQVSPEQSFGGITGNRVRPRVAAFDLVSAGTMLHRAGEGLHRRTV